MVPKILVSKNLEVKVTEINRLLSEQGFSNNHPDLLYFDHEAKLGIEQSRIIKEHFSFKAFKAKAKAVVLENASSLTPEAQNALLKTFEESPEGSLILMGVNSELDLLPTILSRCQVVVLKDEVGINKNDLVKDIPKLINSSLDERFEYVEKLKTKEDLLIALNNYFREQMLKNPNKDNQFFVKELLEAEKWDKHNVNLRAILEYLMLIMP